MPSPPGGELLVTAVRETPSLRARVRCAFRSGESTFYPHLDEVIWIQARRNYSQIFMCGCSFTVRELLSSIEKRLEPYGFFRVQRSAIINLAHVVEIRREGRGRHAVVLADRTFVVVSTEVRDRIESLLLAN